LLTFPLPLPLALALLLFWFTGGLYERHTPLPDVSPQGLDGYPIHQINLESY
jgi:hypothetical protein